LPEWLGLSRADSAPNLTRRLDGRLKASPRLADDLAEILRWANAPTAGIRPTDVTRARGPQGHTPTKLDTAKPGVSGIEAVDLL